MYQQLITQVGEALITRAKEINSQEELQSFFDDLNEEARSLGADESMPLGWVASRIGKDAAARGISINMF